MSNIINKHQPIKGFRYLSTRESAIYNFIHGVYFQVAVNHFNMKVIVPPILAYTKLFTSLGENSDIVRKELYNFTQKDGEEVSLVPEITRVIVEQLAHEKVYQGNYACFGPCFRYERPQKGRYRAFTQGSVEFVGSGSYMTDMELFLFIREFFKQLHINDTVLHLNSIGSIEDRHRYTEVLKTYFAPLLDKMSQNSRDKFTRGAFLRMLDSKDEEDLKYVAAAPKITDHLGEKSKYRYNMIKKMLDSARISYVENPFLVRGLDYYNDIVFEYTHHILGAQSSVCGGGRYDGLFTEVAKVDVAAIGVGFGIDRIMLILEEKMKTDKNLETKCFGAHIVVDIIPIEEIDYEYAMAVGGKFWEKENSIYKINILWEGKVGKRMEKAAKEALYVILIGETEREQNVVKVKNMATGITVEVHLQDILNFPMKFR